MQRPKAQALRRQRLLRHQVLILGPLEMQRPKAQVPRRQKLPPLLAPPLPVDRAPPPALRAPPPVPLAPPPLPRRRLPQHRPWPNASHLPRR